MRVNCNISAIIANNQLSKGQKALDKSIERLSSGYKINRAEDDAAGLAIANKMRTQIKALDRSKNNAADGVYVVQTAEGALSEVENMLQRMRELAVQAADATYSDEDRVAIQKEIDQLIYEVDRVTSTTEYNTMPLLDGTLSRRSYSDLDGVSVFSANDGVKAGDYKFEIVANATVATLPLSAFSGTVTESEAGTVFINGAEIPVGEGESWSDIYDRLIEGCNAAGVTYSADGNLYSEYYGSEESLTVRFSNLNLANKFGYADMETTAYGTDCEIELKDSFAGTASVTYDGKMAMIRDINDFEMKVEIDNAAVGSDATIDVTEIGTMTLQIGANEGQILNVDIPKVNAHILEIDDLKLGTTTTAGRSIQKLDEAISQVSAFRARLGAYQNRLETSVESLTDYKLNIDSALSGVEDCDMAEEMTNYTAKNVLTQASTSILAQANERPQTILQLLQ